MDINLRQISSNRQGQAMVEMVVGLLVLLVLLVGILQIGRLAVAHNRAMAGARAQADALAAQPQRPLQGRAPLYIHDMHPGRDGVYYSQHDTPLAGPHEPVQRAVFRPARQAELYRRVGPNPLHSAETAPHLSAAFDLLYGEQRSERIELYPVIRRWVVRNESIQMEHGVWMPWLRGLDE